MTSVFCTSTWMAADASTLLSSSTARVTIIRRSAGPAVFLGHFDPHQPHLRERPRQLGIDLAGPFHLLDARSHHLVGQPRDGVAEHDLVVGENRQWGAGGAKIEGHGSGRDRGPLQYTRGARWADQMPSEAGSSQSAVTADCGQNIDLALTHSDSNCSSLIARHPGGAGQTRRRSTRDEKISPGFSVCGSASQSSAMRKSHWLSS